VKFITSIILISFLVLVLINMIGCVSQEVRINTDECAEGEIILGRICVIEDLE